MGGIKVLVKYITLNGDDIKGYGYILRRLNAHLYEICMDDDKENTYLIPKENFTEVSVEQNLYDMRNKIR